LELLAAGSKGISYSKDRGASWLQISDEGYFDQLEDEVLEKATLQNGKTKLRYLISKKTLSYAAAIAACAVIIISITNNTNTIITQETLPITTIESYIEDGFLDIDSYEVIALLKDEDLKYIPLENYMFSEDLLEEYLLENINDSSILIE